MPKQSRLSLIEDTALQFKAIRIALTVALGEYVVNFYKGAPATEYRSDDLADALADGLAMEPLPAALPSLGPMGSGNGSKWIKMYAHHRKVAGRRRKLADQGK